MIQKINYENQNFQFSTSFHYVNYTYHTYYIPFFTGIGADILDSTNQNTFTFGRLKEENSWFELDHIQRKHFDSVQLFNGYLREEFHAIHHVLWTSGSNAIYGDLPDRYEFCPYLKFFGQFGDF